MHSAGSFRRHSICRLSIVGLALSFSVACSDTTDPARVPSLFGIVTGNGQSVVAGGVAANPFVIEVLDQNAKGLGGVTVTWTITAGGGLLTSATSTTDSAGTASNRYTAGPVAGTATVTAAVSGLSTVTFTTTITSGAAAIVVSRRQWIGD